MITLDKFFFAEHSVEEADAKRLSIVVRERLRELNYKDNGYILVANKLPALYRGSPQLSFLQNIPWAAVFDLFDPASKVDGLHYACNETTDAVRATIYTLDDFKEVTPDKDALISTRGTTWILSNEEMQKGSWIKCSKDCLYRALSAYKECFLPSKLVCVFLCLAENAVPEMADIMESSFSIFGNSASSCVTILSETTAVADAFIEASKPTLQRELKDCSITGIPWSLLKEIVREMVGPSKFEEPGAKTELPYFTGQSKAVLNKIINSWNDLEVYSPNPRLPMFAEAIERERDAFYKGAQASQINLMQNHTIARSLEKKVTAKVDKALKSLSKENMDANYYVKTVTVPYEPGSGATTLCRRILWNKREDYRCAVVKAITSSTDFQIDKFQQIAYDEKNSNYSLPVLVLVDNFPENDVRHLTDQIMKRRAKCVVLTTLPISKLATNTQFEITPLRKLNDTETSLVKDILINIMSDSQKRREAEEVLEREKRFIWFGLELFGRDYVKIEERLQNHIRSILTAFLGDSQRMHKSVLEMCCFLNKYSDGCVILPHAVALDFLYDTSADKQSSAINEIHEVFGGLLLEEQNETNGYYGWRPAHPLVSDVVTSGISIEETAIRCLEQACSGKAYVMKFLRRQVFRLYLDRKRLSDPVFVEEQALDDGAVGADLENEVFGFYGKRTRYSPVIVDIMDKEENIEGALRVLLTICEKATQIEDKAYAWQQLARFMGYELRANVMDATNELNKRLRHAMKEIQQIKVPIPRTGIDTAHMAVDIAVSLQPSYTNHYTTKGVLYLHQLRDFKTKTSLILALPAAVQICRKALSVYHKALETSREPNHFSMIGKIQANVSLLEIVRDLPCFNTEEGKFTMYLARRAVPPELENALNPEDRDYVQSLGTTTLDLLNELFGHVKLKQTTTYDENEIRGVNNAKIRASNLRRKFYEITGFDKKELSSDDNSLLLSLSSKQEPAVYQQKVQDILFLKDETPYSAWSNLTDGEISEIYQLLKSLCLRGHGSYNDLLICSKAGLQLEEKPPVQELDNIVSGWVQRYPNSEWAHLFYYMIHFPIPNGSLAPCNATARESVKKCGSIVREKAGSGFRKSGAEYFLGKGIGLNAILSSQEFRWLETKWKTKTDFWRGKEPSERLERVQGRKEVGSKGIISYQGIQLHFDNTLYPNESKDDLWFYVGFTLAGPYAYDPVDKDTYTNLKKQMECTTSMTTSRPLTERFDNRDRWSLPPRHSGAGKKTNKTSPGLPQENIRAIQSEQTYTPPASRTRRHDIVRSEDVSEWETGVSDLSYHISSSSVPANSYLPKAKRSSGWGMSAFASPKEVANQQKHYSGAGGRTEPERTKWKSVMATKGNEKRKFSPKSLGSDGKLHHGAFVQGSPKSQECTRHNSTEETHVIRRCNFAHGRMGDTLQFVCTKCTSENRKCCKGKVSHKEYIWNLGPYLNSSGEIWKTKGLAIDQASDTVLEDSWEGDPEPSDNSCGSSDIDWRPPPQEWGEDYDDNGHDDGDRDDEGNEKNGAKASDFWMTLGHNRFSALSE